MEAMKHDITSEELLTIAINLRHRHKIALPQYFCKISKSNLYTVI